MAIRSFVGALLALAAAATYAGCGGGASPADVCNKVCDCVKEAGASCTASQLKQCEDQISAAQDEADKLGCSSEVQDLLDCLNDASCKDLENTQTSCVKEQADVQKCAQGASK